MPNTLPVLPFQLPNFSISVVVDGAQRAAKVELTKQVGYWRRKVGPSLTDEELVKEFRFTQDGNLSVESTTPSWREGMEEVLLGDGGGGAAGGGKTQTFFKWFITNEAGGGRMLKPPR